MILSRSALTTLSLTVLSLLAGAAAAQPARTAAGGDVQNGKRLFMTVGCYQCHGATGAGSSAGPQLAPNPLPMPAFVNQLRHPRRMPPYSEVVMSEAQIADIHAYLASIPPSPPASQIPLLK
jgi:mono/diheme cytochrome c family protein